MRQITAKKLPSAEAASVATAAATAHIDVRRDQFLLSSIVATEIQIAWTNFTEIDIKLFLMNRDCVRGDHLQQC